MRAGTDPARLALRLEEIFMQRRIPITAAILLGFASTSAYAQIQPQPMTPEQRQEMQQQQMACGNDVYTLCGEAIPDRDRITACLKKHWKDVSADCKSTMENYGKHRGRKRGTTGSQQ
jgi:hypothetical protein